MHQTTLRFGADLWEALERECALDGVSVAQYVREAALARVVHAAARRGEDAVEGSQADAAGEPEPELAATSQAGPIDRGRLEADESSALSAQDREARRRSRELGGEIERGPVE